MPSAALPLSSDSTALPPVRVTLAWLATTSPSAVALLTTTRNVTVAKPPIGNAPRFTAMGDSVTTAPRLVASDPATYAVHGLSTPVQVGTASVRRTLAAAADP